MTTRDETTQKHIDSLRSWLRDADEELASLQKLDAPKEHIWSARDRRAGIAAKLADVSTGRRGALRSIERMVGRAVEEVQL